MLTVAGFLIVPTTIFVGMSVRALFARNYG